MLQNNNGFFLAELLLSLTAWILLTAVLLPIYVMLFQQAENLHRENLAIHLLFDELENELDESAIAGDKTIMLDGTVFEINWYNDLPESEVCVEYHDWNSVWKKTCQCPE